MSRKGAAFIRILHWANTSGERVNLACFVYGDRFGPIWRTLTDWSRPAAFIGQDETSLRENVESMIADMADWSPFHLHTRWRHEMSCLQLSEPHPTVYPGSPDELADHAAESFLWPGRAEA